MRPPAERSRGSSPLVSSREPKKFTSMQARNLPSGESSASAMVSLNPALFTRPQSPVGMGCLKRGPERGIPSLGFPAAPQADGGHARELWGAQDKKKAWQRLLAQVPAGMKPLVGTGGGLALPCWLQAEVPGSIVGSCGVAKGGPYLCCWCGPGCAAGHAGYPLSWSGPSAAVSASMSSSGAAPGHQDSAGPARWQTPESP